MPRLDQLAAAPGGLANAETGQPWHDFPGPALFANAYLGARPIVAALADGADIVITGRVADPSLFLAPLITSSAGRPDDWDLLAAGTAIGHLCECSGQSTGGNFSGDWWTIEQPWKLAYPIAECEPDGTAVITKPPGTGGRVDFDTVRHQLLYEVHDPAAYVTPDVVADFTALRLDDLGGDRVRVSGARGRQATAHLQGSRLLPGGLVGRGQGGVRLAGRACQGARDRGDPAQAHSNWPAVTVDEWLAEYWGVNALHGPIVPPRDTGDLPEVLLRMAWRCADAETAGRVGPRTRAARAVSAPVGHDRRRAGDDGQAVTVARPLAALVPKDLVDEQVHHDVTRHRLRSRAGSRDPGPARRRVMPRIQLRDLCGTRSGDKGDIVNIALFAYDAAAYEAIRHAVTAERVAAHFAGLFSGPVQPVRGTERARAQLRRPTSALGGGGPRSLRSDNLGKTLGGALLRMEIEVPGPVAEKCSEAAAQTCRFTRASEPRPPRAPWGTLPPAVRPAACRGGPVDAALTYAHSRPAKAGRPLPEARTT